MNNSHATKRPQHRKAMSRDAIIAALPHGYRVPASSSAKTMRMEAASMKKTPGKSRRRKEAIVKRLRSRLKRFISAVDMSEGRKKIMIPDATAPAGALFVHQSLFIHLGFVEREGRGTYLSKNTHLHVVLSFITPPSSGPRILATANTEEIIAMYFPNFSVGTTAVMTTPTME
jgi:hypothetical protein